MSNKLEVRVEWLAVHADEVGQSAEACRDKYLSAHPHESLFKRHGLAPHLWIPSQRLEPKEGFHRLATRDLEGFSSEAVRTPYPSVNLTSDLPGWITSVGAEVFPGDVIVARVGGKLTVPIEPNLKHTVGRLGPLRSAKGVPMVDALIRRMITFAKGRRNVAGTKTDYNSYFAMQLGVPHSADVFDDFVKPVKQELVALLIGATNAEMLQSDLVEKVHDSSEDLNFKARAEWLLLNRQGFVYVLPSGEYAGPHLHRFDRTRDLAILASYARAFLRDGFAYSERNPDEADSIVRRLGQWITYPEITFDTSVSHTLTWAALSENLLLGERLTARDDYVSSRGAWGRV